MRDEYRQYLDDEPTRPIRRGPGPATLRSRVVAAMANDDPNVPLTVMDNTTRNATLAEDLRLTLLGHGPATHRSARIVATSKHGLNVLHRVGMNAIEPSDPGLNQGMTVPSDSVVSDTDVVSDEEGWEEARPVPDIDIGTTEKHSLTKRTPKNSGRNLFKSLGRRGYEVIAESVHKGLF